MRTRKKSEADNEGNELSNARHDVIHRAHYRAFKNRQQLTDAQIGFVTAGSELEILKSITHCFGISTFPRYKVQSKLIKLKLELLKIQI